MGRRRRTRGLVYTTSLFSERRIENASLVAAQRLKKVEIDDLVTNLG
jgi:hypothetical protein